MGEEVASFYFMFQMSPVGRYNVQVCGTTTCMICGAEDLISVCKEKIGPKAHTPYREGMFSWEEVECLGACANAPMVQIGKDFYEDLTTERFAEILDELAAGRVPTPGPQGGRYASEPKGGLTSLIIPQGEDRNSRNASVQLAVALEDGQTRIQGTEPVADASMINSDMASPAPEKSQDAPQRSAPPPQPEPGSEHHHEDRPEGSEELEAMQPQSLAEAVEGKPDDLQRIPGIGPAIETRLNENGVFHFSQIAQWSDAEVAWVEREIPGAAGRPTRDDWRAAAARLAEEEVAEREPDHNDTHGESRD